MFKIWIRSGIAGCVLGAMVAGFVMYAAWDHNPQEEFHGMNGIQWLPWFGVGLSWFVPTFVLITIVVGVVFSAGERKDGAAKSPSQRR
jgi:hypothetical protein